MPLPHSRPTVSSAAPELSPGISRLTCQPAYAPFTPSKSGQRSLPTYYRGCWHVVSRSLFYRYCLVSSLSKAVYNPKTFFLHAASLRQSFLHCAIFPTAASRRSLGRISVPMWPFILSDRLLIVALVGRYPANKLIRRGPILYHRSFSHKVMLPQCAYAVLAVISDCYPPVQGRLPTRYSPVRH